MGVKIREKVKGSGIWWVYVIHRGMRASHKVGAEDAAIAFKEELEKRLQLGLEVFRKPEPVKTEPEKQLTLREYYGTFQDTYLKTSCRESTQERYRGCFDDYILPRFGDMPLDEIRRGAVKEFVTDLCGKGLAKATIRIIISNLCTMFSHAIEDEIIQANPATRMPKYFKQAKVVHAEIDPLRSDEVAVFLATAIEHDRRKRYADVPEYYPLFLCAIHTGMRAGELAGFQWPDIDWNGKFLMVRRSIKGGRVYPPKTGKTRRIDMSDALIEELQALKKRRLEEYFQRGKSEIPEWVFCNSDGNHLDIRNVVNRHFNKCLAAAKLRRIRFHDLRHTFASLLIGNGESLAYVKDQMGHSSIKVTVDVYGHLVPGANRQAMNRLPVAGENAPQAHPEQKRAEIDRSRSALKSVSDLSSGG